MKKLLTSLALIACLLVPMEAKAADVPDEYLTTEEKERIKEAGDRSRAERAANPDIVNQTRAISKIKLTYVSQGSNQIYCGPASVSMILKTLISSNLSLPELAKMLGTSETIPGTAVPNIVDVLNNQLDSTIYELYKVSIGADLPGDIERTINKGYPLIYDVLTNANMPGYNNSNRWAHYIVGNGYKNIYSTSAEVTYTDPNGNNLAAKGEHTIDLSDLEEVLLDHDGGYYVAYVS